MYIPTKESARNALNAFVPKAGHYYTNYRNFDYTKQSNSSVSRLSPWIRNRILTEWEVITAVLEHHSTSSASKFIEEVCWRTYWKGWLQLRPIIWHIYEQDVVTLNRMHADSDNYIKAIEGRTGIDCFDTWNYELTNKNYLHNHARMWYSSIWIHTLKLPWELGADWFFRNLLDGDPASNTLSWRWVAGLHTRGKSYLARPDNIKKFSEREFKINKPLVSYPVNIKTADLPKPCTLRELAPIPNNIRLGLIITNEDISAVDWIGSVTKLSARINYFPEQAYRRRNVVPKVIEFHRNSMINCSKISTLFDDSSHSKILDWAKGENLDGFVLADPTVGPTETSLKQLRKQLESEGLRCYTVRHWWDQTLYPHSARGFFHFKKAIPSVLYKLKNN